MGLHVKFLYDIIADLTDTTGIHSGFFETRPLKFFIIRDTILNFSRIRISNFEFQNGIVPDGVRNNVAMQHRAEQVFRRVYNPAQPPRPCSLSEQCRGCQVYGILFENWRACESEGHCIGKRPQDPGVHIPKLTPVTLVENHDTLKLAAAVLLRQIVQFLNRGDDDFPS